MFTLIGNKHHDNKSQQKLRCVAHRPQLRHGMLFARIFPQRQRHDVRQLRSHVRDRVGCLRDRGCREAGNCLQNLFAVTELGNTELFQIGIAQRDQILRIDGILLEGLDVFPEAERVEQFGRLHRKNRF